MGIQKRTELKKILTEIPNNAIITADWLESRGVSRQLLFKYKNNGWLNRIGSGAYTIF